MQRFRWLDTRSVLMYNQEGKHQELGRGGDTVTTRLIPEATLERYIREGKAERV